VIHESYWFNGQNPGKNREKAKILRKKAKGEGKDG
jgi:hypothetical protein